MNRLLDLFRSDIAKLSARRQKIHDDLETARRRREYLLTAPPHPVDLAKILTQLLDRSADRYPARLMKTIDFMLKDPLIEVTSPGLAIFHPLLLSEGLNHPSLPDLETSITFVLRDQVKAGMIQAVHAMKYTHGPGRAERVTELSKLEETIASLELEARQMEAEIDELKNELS